ncbi:hypothetical protein Mycsm_04344 [Mycobacterium sp. JS623]|uniref:SGNH/GDSL hydrolase family protein n=1 Tax=Mycobacterium sp. JS623 TaxID=212767 RepID=UPI0002A59D2A|nr:SGNH/GDSL hydrolase family protein [Mycobacterium sp. JS623]AGB24589.1 hypothetical protein Mycsm_04344 [Mycobacterium sp. JS623]
MTGRYVALGSAMAAGPGIAPRVTGSPFLAFRSARNYPHLLAESLSLDLVDVTYAGATTAHVLYEKQNGTPPQTTVLNGSESLVTVTIGHNDVGYMQLLTSAYFPHAVRSMPIIGDRLRDLHDYRARNRALAMVAEALIEVGSMLRRLAPQARIFFIDCLTLLPDRGFDAPPLSRSDVDLGRHVAETLERHTAEAAAETGCEIVRAGAASRSHHAWSPDPWTTKGAVPLPGRLSPFQPNAAGLRAIADLVVAQVGKQAPSWSGQSERRASS